MKIAKNLNLVFPITRADGGQLYAHSTPVGAEIFETYWETVSLTYSRILQGGHVHVSGPRIADKMLRKVATEQGVWEGPTGVERGLVAEIKRLTNVLTPGKNGWESYPLDDAKAKGVIDAEDVGEVVARATFFSVFSHMLSKEERAMILEGAAIASGARIELLSCSEFMSSLPRSTPAAAGGVKAGA